ncbi:pyridoxal-phosphate-dependent aminotransferase family protein [Enterococcus avium]|uniref:pyridoxal-phosphate-dependent aminotransferase family protein n=1 Tax=Enterococcus avium TaxID=33945 RepID=UPI00288DFCC8|nr:alanine--glyoxylate aminotransferase family protein [Enterococcus avium]MDT2485073.1 alanine--glyoxylate aminotransferase family protein [Enterococcus avium]MDT2511431.1 alanine--glyoxylate aminotransferase family protein [Enterococcus avium]
MDKKIQMLVGPTALPPKVKKAMLHDAYSHRSSYYKEIQHRVTEGMKKIFGTKKDVLLLTTSGTGVMEASIQNIFMPGDEVIIPINGVFGELFYDVAKGYDLKIKRIDFDYGYEVDINEVLAAITTQTKGILMIHNESSAGVVNDVKSLGLALKDSDVLLIVDSVSGAGGLELNMDDWFLDGLFTTSQKALMSPPGLSFVSLSDKAWAYVERANNQKYLFNFKRDRDYVLRDLTVHTPATHTLLAVDAALTMIFAEGLENVIHRHSDNAALLRKELTKLGFELFAKDDNYASATLTSVFSKDNADYYVKELAKENIIISGGKSPLKKDTFRIGTMGYVSRNDVIACIEALKRIATK